jgi:hypothetical protein
LPFANETEEEEVETFVRETFYAHFSPASYDDVEITEVDRILASLEKIRSRPYKELSPQELGRILMCDAFVYGTVKKFQKIFVGVFAQMSATAYIEIVDAARGDILWADEMGVTSREGGIPLGPTGAAQAVVRSSIHMWDAEKVAVVDKLCRTLTEKIPDFKWQHVPIRETDLCDLQIASFKSKASAEALSGQLHDGGYKTFVRSVERGDGPWFRVMLGPFLSRDDATDYREKIGKEFSLLPIIVQSDTPK